MADIGDLKSPALRRAGSSPAIGTEIMKIKEIAIAVLQQHEEFTCKIQRKNNQLLLQSSNWPDETFCLLSPTYQNKIRDDSFTENDLQEVLIEAERIFMTGK